MNESVSFFCLILSHQVFTESLLASKPQKNPLYHLMFGLLGCKRELSLFTYILVYDIVFMVLWVCGFVFLVFKAKTLKFIRTTFLFISAVLEIKRQGVDTAISPV